MVKVTSIIVVVIWLLETVFLYVTLVLLKLALYIRLASNSQRSDVVFPSVCCDYVLLPLVNE